MHAGGGQIGDGAHPLPCLAASCLDYDAPRGDALPRGGDHPRRVHAKYDVGGCPARLRHLTERAEVLAWPARAHLNDRRTRGRGALPCDGHGAVRRDGDLWVNGVATLGRQCGGGGEALCTGRSGAGLDDTPVAGVPCPGDHRLPLRTNGDAILGGISRTARQGLGGPERGPRLLDAHLHNAIPLTHVLPGHGRGAIGADGHPWILVACSRRRQRANALHHPAGRAVTRTDLPVGAVPALPHEGDGPIWRCGQLRVISRLRKHRHAVGRLYPGALRRNCNTAERSGGTEGEP